VGEVPLHRDAALRVSAHVEHDLVVGLSGARAGEVGVRGHGAHEEFGRRPHRDVDGVELEAELEVDGLERPRIHVPEDQRVLHAGRWHRRHREERTRVRPVQVAAERRIAAMATTAPAAGRQPHGREQQE
jgi:hypothetical protein